MKGYVKTTLNPAIIIEMTAIKATAHKFVKDYNPKTYEYTKTRKHFFGLFTESFETLPDEIKLPRGLYQNGFCMGQNIVLGELNLLAHNIQETKQLKCIKKILALYVLNTEVYLDDELASVYNNFIK